MDQDDHPLLTGLGARIAAIVAPFHPANEAATEFLWSALHGLAELERTGRIRPEARPERLSLLIRALVNA